MATLSPIPTVLSALRAHRVRALLMGGQACIVYGGAEFSRDVDIVVSAVPKDLARLRDALDDLGAEPVYFPPLSPEALLRGHACHFRCHPRGTPPVRLDVMSVLRNAPPFEALWTRRRRVRLPGVGLASLLALEDLVAVKKTQRDKDWPMVRRLVEADMAQGGASPAPERVAFWLRECRTAELLVDLAGSFRRRARALSRSRPVLAAALAGDVPRVERGLRAEEDRERRLDRRWWAPLRADLERWRLERPRARRRDRRSTRPGARDMGP